MVDSLLGKLFYTKPNLSSYDVRNFHGALPNESGLSSVVRLCTSLSNCTYPYKRDCLNYQFKKFLLWSDLAVPSLSLLMAYSNSGLRPLFTALHMAQEIGPTGGTLAHFNSFCRRTPRSSASRGINWCGWQDLNLHAISSLGV
jgi:hypothetical protein